MAADVLILILAAGGATRMRGGDKLTERVEGEPLLRRQARAALATGCPVIVVLPPDRPDRAATLAGLAVEATVATDAADGMTASLRQGLRRAEALRRPGGAGLMVLPGDMPDLGTAELASVIAAFRATPDRIVRGAAADGQPGHPAVFPADLWPALHALTGDEGGRSVIAAQRNRVRLIPLPGLAATTDLDTPEDWAAWRARRV